MKSCKEVGCVCFECVETDGCFLFYCHGKSVYPEGSGRSECPLLESEKKNKTGAELVSEEKNFKGLIATQSGHLVEVEITVNRDYAIAINDLNKIAFLLVPVESKGDKVEKL